MNTASEILQAFRDGDITLSECWNLLNGLRLAKSISKMVRETKKAVLITKGK